MRTSTYLRTVRAYIFNGKRYYYFYKKKGGNSLINLRAFEIFVHKNVFTSCKDDNKKGRATQTVDMLYVLCDDAFCLSCIN